MGTLTQSCVKKICFFIFIFVFWCVFFFFFLFGLVWFVYFLYFYFSSLRNMTIGGRNIFTSFFSAFSVEVGFAIEAEIRVTRRGYVCKGNDGAC